MEVLDRLALAIFVVDVSAGISFAHRAAEALVSHPDGVWAGPNGLCASTGTLTNRLRTLVAEVAGIGHDVAVGGVMAFERASLKRAYQALVSPLTARTSWCGQ
jgi:hypothetical protein